MRAEKKEMTPVIREYTINLNKACHKVYVSVLRVMVRRVSNRLGSSPQTNCV